MRTNNNIIKVRDDNKPIEFTKSSDNMFELTTESSADWAPERTFTVSDLRGRIEPWLSSLFQSEHLSLLVGSGLTSAIQYAACGSSNNGMSDSDIHSRYSLQILEKAAESA